MATNNAINTGKPIEVANGGTGTTTSTGTGSVVLSNSPTLVTPVLGAASATSLTLGTDLAVADGGTGASTFTDAGVLIGNGTGAIQATSAGTAGQVLTSNGAGVDPTFQTLSASGKDMVRSISQTSHGFAVGDVIRSSGTAGQYTKAQADSSANAEVVGIVTVVTDADTFTMTMGGYIDTAAAVPAATAGSVLFLSPTTAGALTTTQPSTVGQVVKPVAIVDTSASKMIMINMRGNDVTNAGSGGGVIASGSLGSAATSLTVSSIPAYDHLRIYIHIPTTLSDANSYITLRFNGDTGSNYGADSGLTDGFGGQNPGSVPTTSAYIDQSSSTNRARTYFISLSNMASYDKIGTYMGTHRIGTVTGGNRPTSVSGVIQWENTSAQISSITLRTSDGSTTMPTGTRMIIYGASA